MYSQLIHSLRNIKDLTEQRVGVRELQEAPRHLVQLPHVLPAPLPHQLHPGLLPEAGGWRHVARGGEGGAPLS